MDIHAYTALELAALVKTRQISAEEVLDASLERIEKVDGRPGSLDAASLLEDEKKVHAFITHTVDLARQHRGK